MFFTHINHLKLPMNEGCMVVIQLKKLETAVYLLAKEASIKKEFLIL